MEPVTADDRDADRYRKKYAATKSTGPLTFSIARIMEPDVVVRTRPPVAAVAAAAAAAASTADRFHALESAFKKYVPSGAEDRDATTTVPPDAQTYRHRAGQPPSSRRSRPTSPAATARPPSAKEQTPAKTFTCNHCGKVFYAHYNLTRHMPVHTGARPFVCKVQNVLARGSTRFLDPAFGQRARGLHKHRPVNAHPIVN